MYPVLLLIAITALALIVTTIFYTLAKKKKVKRKARKTFTVSILRFVYIIYVIKALTGKRPREILAEFMAGNIKEVTIENALNVLDIIEERGLEIAVEAAFVAFAMEWFKTAIGRRTLLKMGPLRITP